MKTIKLNFLLIIMALGVFTFTSCEDEFTEEDFLNQQAQLAASQQAFNLEKLILEYNLIRKNDSASMVFQQQLASFINNMKDTENLAALAQAGLLVKYNLIVEDQAGNPISGATVVFNGDSTVGGKVQAATNTIGMAVGTNLPIGSLLVSVAAPNFLTTRFLVDFGNVSSGEEFIIVGEDIYPLGREETNEIILVSTNMSTGTFATVNGTATIESNITNPTPETPQNVTIVAHLMGDSGSGHSLFYSSNSGATISNFRFVAEGIGSAVVDNTTGAWSMMLPATEDGIYYDFVVPTLTVDQTIAIDERNKVAITPEIATVPTVFGPNAGSYSTINSVPGARIDFPAPPVAGSGFALTFTQVISGLTGGNNNFENDEEELLGNTIYRLTSRGSALSSAPTGTASAGTATGGSSATFETSIAGRITAVGIAAAGTGFAVNDVVRFTVTPQNAANVATATDVDGPNTTGAFNNLSNFTVDVTVTTIGGGGTITAISTPSTLGFGSDAYFGRAVSQYVVSAVTPQGTSVGTGANFNIAGVSGFVHTVYVNATGGGYTSAPTSITWAGGNAVGGTPTLPSLTAVATSFRYNVTPNNASSANYSVLPGMSYNITATFGSAPTNTANVNVIDGNIQAGAAQSLVGEFTLSGGQPVLKNSTQLVYRTDLTFTAPVAVITNVPAIQARRRLLINANTGVITGLAAFDTNQGDHNGSGYTAPFGGTVALVVATAPGSGGIFTLPLGNFTLANGEYQWNGIATLVQGGSGYSSNLNGTGQIIYSGPSSLSAKSGQTTTINVTYGTGRRTQNVD